MPKTDILLRDVEVPEGYEATGEFRALTYGDLYLDMGGGVGQVDCTEPWFIQQPLRRAVILKKKAPKFPEPIKGAVYEFYSLGEGVTAFYYLVQSSSGANNWTLVNTLNNSLYNEPQTLERLWRHMEKHHAKDLRLVATSLEDYYKRKLGTRG